MKKLFLNLLILNVYNSSLTCSNNNFDKKSDNARDASNTTQKLTQACMPPSLIPVQQYNLLHQEIFLKRDMLEHYNQQLSKKCPQPTCDFSTVPQKLTEHILACHTLLLCRSLTSRGFVCCLCHHIFKRQFTHLLSHIRTYHSTEYPFECTIANCKKNFPSKSQLNEHYKRKHQLAWRSLLTSVQPQKASPTRIIRKSTHTTHHEIPPLTNWQDFEDDFQQNGQSIIQNTPDNLPPLHLDSEDPIDTYPSKNESLESLPTLSDDDQLNPLPLDYTLLDNIFIDCFTPSNTIINPEHEENYDTNDVIDTDTNQHIIDIGQTIADANKLQPVKRKYHSDNNDNDEIEYFKSHQKNDGKNC